MFKIIFNINTNNIVDKNSIKKEFGWKKRDKISILINSYLSTKKMILFFPIDSNSYEVVWSSQKDFEEFLLENNYIELKDILKEYFIDISWHF